MISLTRRKWTPKELEKNKRKFQLLANKQEQLLRGLQFYICRMKYVTMRTNAFVFQCASICY